MQRILLGIVLVLVIGFLGFSYRNDIEQSFMLAGKLPTPVTGAACTDEAKICPDGTAVGRTGPSCAFAPCALPNVEITVASSTIGFVLPSGYVAETNAPGSDTTHLAAFTKPSDTQSPDTILIRDYPTPDGQTGQQVMLANTTLEPSGLQATSTSLFSTALIRRNTFYAITTQHSGGTVDSSYFLIRTHDVLRFEIQEKDVANATHPNLNIAALPEHQSLLQMLATLDSSS